MSTTKKAGLTDLRGAALLKKLQDSGLSKTDFWRKHLSQHITYDAFHGRIWRATEAAGDRPDLFAKGGALTHGAPFALSGDFVITGDWQLPTTNYDFAALPSAIGQKHLPKGNRRLIIAGDFINADAFTTYESDLPTPAFEDELAAAEWLVGEMLRVYNEIYWIMGNHERRIGKRTRGALNHNRLRSLITRDERVKVSPWGHLTIDTPQGIYRVTHACNYSVNQLTVASELAQKFQQHIISHHEHHCGIGWDRFGRYIVVNNGGIFADEQMDYAVMDDGKNPRMKRGFTLLKDGVPTLLSRAPMTNWDMWL